MKTAIVLALLALVTLTCSVIEGLVEGLSPQFIQISGLLTIVCSGALIVWTLKVQAERFYKD